MQKKIIIAITLQVIVISFTLGIISYFTINESIDRLLTNRLALAKIISNDVEVFLNNSLNRLYDLSLSGKINLSDDDMETERKMLETAFNYSPFTEGVFLLDRHGNEVLTYPPHIEYFSNLTHINFVNQVFRLGKSVISDIYTIEPTKQKVIFMIVPLWDAEGNVDGIAGGILSPTSHSLNQILHGTRVGENSFIEIIDSHEVIVASDNPLRVLRHHTHNPALTSMIAEGKAGIVKSIYGYADDPANAIPAEIHTTEPYHLAVVPLRVAGWAVIVGQAEKEIFAPITGLRNKFLLLVFIFIGTSIVFSIGMTKNIIRPLRLLTASSNRIASGDLSTPVGRLGSDELLTLSRSFDTMRHRLAESLEHVRNQNIELEQRVAARTREIIESREKVAQLLKMIITSQEEERRRIARELHDTILQDMSACLIKMDTMKLLNKPVMADAIDDIRNITTNSIDSIYEVIKDLRPLILDDLGIESSLLWMLNKHLKKKGITYHLDRRFSVSRRFPPEVEITLFRILQELIINIARHSNAENVFVTIEGADSHIAICIADDGDGFNMEDLRKYPLEDGRGLGLLGIQERSLLIDGEFELQSLPGEGTNACIRIPFSSRGQHD